MSNPLLEFETHTGLTVTQSAKLLAIPRPTYYQYRRSGDMPPMVIRLVEAMTSLPKATLNRFIRDYVFDDEL